MQWGAAGLAGAALARLEPGREGRIGTTPRVRAEDVDVLDKLIAVGRGCNRGSRRVRLKRRMGAFRDLARAGRSAR